MSRSAVFDPKRHLCYDGSKPQRTYMKEIGYPVLPGTSEVAFTASFPLFTEEAVKILRSELLQDCVKDPSGPFVRVVPGLSSYQVRGYGGVPGYGDFTKETTYWAPSEAGGIDLVPVMEYELANVNVQLTHGSKTLEFLRPDPLKGPDLASECEQSSDMMTLPVINWHKDSYAWTCVVMLSDPTNMQYGDIVIKTGNGDTLSVPPCAAVGHAILLQGGYITHLARRGINVPERVTMVPSFRPKNPNARDDSSLINSYKISNLNRLHYEWTVYRLDLLSKRFESFSTELKGRRAACDDWEKRFWPTQIVDKGEFKDWAELQISYLKFTIEQMELK